MESKEEISPVGGKSSGIGLIIAKLVSRLLCFTFTLISLVTLAVPIFIENNNFINNALFYRYALCSTVIGLVYSLLQISVSMYNLSTGGNGEFNSLVPLDFCGDLVVLYALATGAVTTADLKVSSSMVLFKGNSLFVYMSSSNNVAATSLIIGSIYAAISLVISTYDLYKRFFLRRCKENQNIFC